MIVSPQITWDMGSAYDLFISLWVSIARKVLAYVLQGLLNGLKALADPTRLRILKYLIQESCTPSELAKDLRLRPPTVIHHLTVLRLAGFVQVTMTANAERRYAARKDGILDTARYIHSFLLEN